MPEDGGNTRLKVLNTLWSETGDPVFYHIVVKFIPWVSESSVLANHLIENIARADMTFHDQAVGFYELRREWERERNEPITDIGFLSMLKDRGLDEVSRTDFVRMRFVVEHLLHALPIALEAGLGPRYIDNIKAYHRLYKEYWQSKKKREDAFTVLFQEALTSLDDPEFAIGMIPKMVESRISAQLGMPLTQVRLEIDLIRSAALAGRLPDHPPTSSTATQPVATTSPKSNSTRAYGPADHNREPSPKTANAQAVPATRPSDALDLKTLRQHCFDSAETLARANAITCIHSAPTLGMGFHVDIPAEPFLGRPQHEMTQEEITRQHIWWLLISASEQLTTRETLAQVAGNNHLRDLMLSCTEDEIRAVIGTAPAISHLHFHLFNNQLSNERDDNYHLFTTLTESCRRLRRFSISAGENLWRGE